MGAAIAAPGEATGWLALCGSAPDGIGPGAIAGLIDVARRNGWRVAVDTSGAPLREALSAGPDVVKVNAHEAAEIVGDGPPEVLVERLEVLAPTTVAIVTAGTDGAYARGIAARCDRHGRYPTGSGDAFLAALLTNLDGGALRHDRPRVHLPGALRAAVGAAAANAQRPGAGVVDARQAAAFSQDVIIT